MLCPRKEKEPVARVIALISVLFSFSKCGIDSEIDIIQKKLDEIKIQISVNKAKTYRSDTYSQTDYLLLYKCFVRSIQTLYKKFYLITHDLSLAIEIIKNLENAICIFFFVLFLSVVVRYIAQQISKVFFNQNSYIYYVIEFILDNLTTICFSMINVLTVHSVQLFVGQYQSLKILQIKNKFTTYVLLFSYIALLNLINVILNAIIKILGRKVYWINVFRVPLNTITNVRIIKLILISFVTIISEKDGFDFAQDMDKIEILVFLSLFIFSILTIKNFSHSIDSRVVQVVKYTSVPLLYIVLVSYISNYTSVFVYKTIITVLVWPFIYLIYSLCIMFAYNYIKTIPTFARRDAIEIYLIIKNSIYPYVIMPVAIIIMVKIFNDVDILSDIRSFMGPQIYYRLLIMICIMLVLRVIFIINRCLFTIYAENEISKRQFDKQRITTFSTIVQSISAGIIIFILSTITLTALGFDVAPLFQMISLFAASLSLTAQNWIRDIINGAFILYENTIKIGDWLDYDGKTAVVEDMQLRYLRIRYDDGALVTIPFHKIDVITNKSRQYSYVVLNIAFNIKVDMNLAEQAVLEAFSNIKERSEFKYRILKDIEIRDIADMTSFAYIMQYRVCTQPQWQNKVRRALNKELKNVFAKYDISIATPAVANTTNVPSITTSEPYPDFQ